MSGFARRRPSSLPTRGLTLLEMLVTLVIVALVAAILGQALGQLARIERLLESGQLRSAAAALQRWPAQQPRHTPDFPSFF